MIPTLVYAMAVAQADAQQLKQRFYLEARVRQYAAAMQDARAYLAIRPDDDAFALDYAYVLCNAGKNAQAASLLQRLASSSSPSIAQAARAQLRVTAGPIRASGLPASLFAYAEPDSRYRDMFYGARYQLDLRRSALAYAVADLNSDTRSGAPDRSAVFNTDTLLIGAGTAVRLDPYTRVRIEAGPSIGLRGQRSMLEVRAAAVYWRESSLSSSSAPHTAAGGTLQLSSRFPGDLIGYASVSHDIRITGPVRVLAGLNAGWDSKRLYYNNFAEALAGVQLRVSAVSAVRLEVLNGMYVGAGVPLDVNRSYMTVRGVFTTGMSRP